MPPKDLVQAQETWVLIQMGPGAISCTQHRTSQVTDAQ